MQNNDNNEEPEVYEDNLPEGYMARKTLPLPDKTKLWDVPPLKYPGLKTFARYFASPLDWKHVTKLDFTPDRKPDVRIAFAGAILDYSSYITIDDTLHLVDMKQMDSKYASLVGRINASRLHACIRDIFNMSYSAGMEYANEIARKMFEDTDFFGDGNTDYSGGQITRAKNWTHKNLSCGRQLTIDVKDMNRRLEETVGSRLLAYSKSGSVMTGEFKLMVYRRAWWPTTDFGSGGSCYWQSHCLDRYAAEMSGKWLALCIYRKTGSENESCKEIPGYKRSARMWVYQLSRSPYLLFTNGYGYRGDEILKVVTELMPDLEEVKDVTARLTGTNLYTNGDTRLRTIGVPKRKLTRVPALGVYSPTFPSNDADWWRMDAPNKSNKEHVAIQYLYNGLAEPPADAYYQE